MEGCNLSEPGQPPGMTSKEDLPHKSVPTVQGWFKHRTWPTHFTFENLLFGAVQALSLFIAVNGKPLSSCLFTDAHCTVRLDPNHLALHVVLVTSVGLFVVIRTLTMARAAAARGLLGGVATLVACAGVVYFHTPPSPLVLFLVLGICLASTFVVFSETYLYKAMEADFWKLAFESILKLYQFSIIAVALIVSALGVITDERSDMVTTLAYPLAVIIIQCVVIAWWNLVPLWERVVESYRITDVTKAQD